MLQMLLPSEISGLLIRPRGDDIPGRPPIAEVIQCRQLACDMIRLIIGTGDRCRQSDMLGGCSQRSEQCEGLRANAIGMANPGFEAVPYVQLIGIEEHIELAAFCRLDDFFIVVEIKQPLHIGQRMPPTGNIPSRREKHHRSERHLSLRFTHFISLHLVIQYE